MSMAAESPKHVLEGYKVLDLTQVLAGPAATRLMAEMGAEIIKVELPPKGDLSRAMPLVRDGRSAYYVQQNRGKKSICVDLKNPAGLTAIKEMIPKVDVLIENFSPGVIGRLGLDYETVKSINPSIIMCSVSAFGQKGLLSQEPGYDYIAQAYAAVTHMIGEPDGAPYFPMLGLGDASTGVHAMGAIACALLYRERTGKGQYLDISLLRAYFAYHDMNVEVYSASGGTIKPKRAGLHHSLIAPCGVFKGRESYLIIMAFLDHQWAKLCEIMGKAELAREPRFVTGAKRVEHLSEMVEVIQGWLSSMPSDEAILNALRAARIPVAPVLSIAQAVNHPHLREERVVRKVTDRILGEFEVPGFPLRFSEFPDDLPLQAPFLGEHNEEVLTRYLGYSPDRIKQLENQGVLHRGRF